MQIVIPIDKQILSTLKNRLPFVDHTFQMRDKEKKFGTISVLMHYHLYASLLANGGCIFFAIVRHWLLGSLVLMGSLCVTGCIESAGPLAFVHSCVYG